MKSLLSVVITGVGRGIGYRLTEVFAAIGDAKIFAVARNTSSLEALVAVYPSQIIPVKYDLMQVLHDGNGLSDMIAAQTNKVDILINNAGLLINQPFDVFSTTDIQRIFDVNYMVPAQLIQSLLPLLRRVQGHVVNISSMGGFQGSVKFSGLSHYSASKAALSVLTECLAAEHQDVRFNALALGAVQTEMFTEAFPGHQAPLSVTQAATFIADFARNGHRYFNGKILPVALSNP